MAQAIASAGNASRAAMRRFSQRGGVGGLLPATTNAMRIMWRPAMSGGRLARSFETMKPSLAFLLAAVALAGCSVGGDGASDKAGGSEAPLVLRLAYPYNPNEGQPDEPSLRYFARQVAKLSEGGMRVRISFGAAGEAVPEIEARVARMVRRGEFDLGWVATRAWDQLGVRSFQALQAPFLITDYALLDRVAQDPLADRMLAGLSRLDLEGLAVVPELLRHPNAPQALVSLEAFEGVRIRSIPSDATDALVSALGATPVHVSNARFGDEISRGNVRGAELPTSRARQGWTVAANVTFFGKANTIFAGTDVLEQLTPDQREVLRSAARQTVRQVVAHPPSERAMARSFCASGRIALASRAQLARLRRAAQPVYERLERDALTRSLIERIRAMKRSAHETEPAPRPCGRSTPAAAQQAQEGRSPESFDGTYRWRLTAEGARRSGNPGDPDIGSVQTMTLREGRWLLGLGDNPHYSGTFTVRGDRLVFDWPGEGYALTISFKRDPSGSLEVRPVLPMDRGDQFVWASEPWRRVGPPVRDVP
jgi:TRAP-type C4-dicarboxylate transport system substrate-binding protein